MLQSVAQCIPLETRFRVSSFDPVAGRFESPAHVKKIIMQKGFCKQKKWRSWIFFPQPPFIVNNQLLISVSRMSHLASQGSVARAWTALPVALFAAKPASGG